VPGRCARSGRAARTVCAAGDGHRQAGLFGILCSLLSFLAEKHVATLIISGSETDVCVLSSVLDAVDYSFRVIVVEDARCSSSDAGHDALMTLYRTRFTEQIELLTVDETCALWHEQS
jgi:nicotinamidase-related amidase